jgi:hypothetical protein
MSGGCSHQYHNRVNGSARESARASASEREQVQEYHIQISCMVAVSQGAHMKPVRAT